MSQIFADTGSTPLADVEFLTAQTGTNPVGPDGSHNIDIFAEESSSNNLQGIQTRGDAAANTLYIQLTNRASGFVSTNDATPTTLVSFSLGATPGVYSFQGAIEAFASTVPAGACYTFNAAVRTTGGAGVEIGTEFKDVFEEAAFAAADFNVIVSGNNLIVQVIGLVGTAIDWRGLVNYRFVG
jgi:hypothetical protein